ncbi:pentapeptide repeat-containing protein [Rhizobium sp. TH2]|uniref:pentapeptide repeat-containing protein n=1 Tax=Rhizobium sp. TH2 TaxID=2775403 RepID=UPI0021589B81|nr:pentapeptide repeat-containing protein [Rhizobium sp. TH2]UVC07147.1 pentapeptide repeat-containing protein [Rhizobium sp. TH2]
MKALIKSTLSSYLVVAGLLGFSCTDAQADDCQAAPTPGIDWQDCDKKLLMLGGSNLEGAKLVGTDFTTTDLSDASLLGANLEKAKLLRATLARSAAKGASFVRAEAYRTDFTGIGADDANFESAELQRSNFKDAKLSNVNFTKADLGRSQFDGAEVGGSRFSLANLARADFRATHFSSPVDFERAFFFLTRVEGVDLSTATGLSQWQLDMACGDDKTVLPEGLKKPDQWPCKFQQE